MENIPIHLEIALGVFKVLSILGILFIFYYLCGILNVIVQRHNQYLRERYLKIEERSENINKRKEELEKLEEELKQLKEKNNYENGQ